MSPDPFAGYVKGQAPAAPPPAPPAVLPGVDPYPKKPLEPPRPARPDPSNPQWRHEVAHEAVKVAGITATLAAIARYVPHPYVRYPALFLAGLAASGQAKVKPTPQIGLNAAPIPVGYAEPSVYGLSKAWWLPPGSTTYIPQEVDKLGVGLPEQRAADRAYARYASLLRARDALQGESNETLQALLGPAEDLPTLSRANIIAATSGATRDDLRLAAADILGLLAPAPPQVTAGAWGGPVAPLPSGFVELPPAVAGTFAPDAAPVTSATSIDGAGNRNRIGQEAHVETRDP